MITKERIKELAAEASTLDGIGAAPYKEVIRAIERALHESAPLSLVTTDNDWHEAMAEVSNLQRDREHLHRELAVARAKYEAAVNKLTSIYGVMNPPDTEANGKTYRFMNPHANDCLQALSDEIRAIPAFIAAAQPSPLRRTLIEALDEYDRHTAKVSLGAEDASLGCSVYNWRKRISAEIRAEVNAEPRSHTAAPYRCGECGKLTACSDPLCAWAGPVSAPSAIAPTKEQIAAAKRVIGGPFTTQDAIWAAHGCLRSSDGRANP